ncbi:non-ribosomal peptide synthetase [Micromonospora sp. NPDC051543]|uniref:non-ribosomal peptide synthetase n=1 Tax=Micromonospora sp. NPDC051543 TaxID=3364287 RepID=UPI0037A8827F
MPQPTDGRPATLLESFRRTVTEHADRPAVSDDDQRLTYRELDARSTALATLVADRGIGVEDRVALYLERGVDFLVAVVGVLKAGAAYVAVDPRYPDNRRDFMIGASGARLILTTPGWSTRISHLDVTVEEFRSAPVSGEAAGPAPAIAPDSLACLLFTSGTSGSPKAIALEHRNLVAFGANPALPALRPDDRVAQVSSVSFDAFHFETWCSFAHGAEIVVLPSFPDLIGGEVQRELRQRRITAMLAPTMAVNQVLREDRDTFTGLRILHTGGDVLLPAASRDLLDSGFSGEFFNLYGPSEGTTACTAYQVREVPDDADTVPIGAALAGVRIHLLNSALDPVADGATGEIHIGGDGVARGYVNDPALTAERFLPDPFAGEGRRMYATGDLARVNAAGQLEFLGRVDDQVKIRGYRVEPREAERALYQHPDVRDAAVLVAGTADNRHLVAFIVPHETASPKSVRAHAEKALPDYLVPSDFIIVPAIPGDDHGKRDLGHLHRLLAEHQSRRERWVEPSRPHEKYLADLWEKLLAAENIGTADDFFELGGHSLLAFRVQRAIQRDLGIKVEFRAILENGVLRSLAEVIELQLQADGTR